MGSVSELGRGASPAAEIESLIRFGGFARRKTGLLKQVLDAVHADRGRTLAAGELTTSYVRQMLARCWASSPPCRAHGAAPRLRAGPRGAPGAVTVVARHGFGYAGSGRRGTGRAQVLQRLQEDHRTRPMETRKLKLTTAAIHPHLGTPCILWDTEQPGFGLAMREGSATNREVG